MSKVIKIFSGTSEYGGSTVAHIYLTNLLCEAGYDCSFWGPHLDHIGKCRGGLISNTKVMSNDIIISHFIPSHVFAGVKCALHVLSVHETRIFPLSQHYNPKVHQLVQFVCNAQKEFHNVECPHFICHPVVDPTLKKSEVKPSSPVAAVVGSIDRNKQPHVSIARALKDGHTKIHLYGKYVLRDGYYETAVQPLIDFYPDIITPPEMCNDRQKMYDSVTDVYISTVNEPWSYLRPECEATGTKFHGTAQIEKNFDVPMKSREEILKIWVKELGL